MKNNEKDILNDFAIKIVERNLSVAAIFFLESTKYISFIGSQFLVFLGPISTMFVNDKKYYQFINLIEKKENIEYLINQIDQTVEFRYGFHNSIVSPCLKFKNFKHGLTMDFLPKRPSPLAPRGGLRSKAPAPTTSTAGIAKNLKPIILSVVIKY